MIKKLIVFAILVYGAFTSASLEATYWEIQENPTNSNYYLYSVWGSDSNDVFAVGHVGTIVRYNGSSWSLMNSGVNLELRGIWGSSSDNVFAVSGGVGEEGKALFYDGNANGNWTLMNIPTTERLFGVWGSSETNVIAVGLQGTILRYDGNEAGDWEQIGIGVTINNLYCVYGLSSAQIYAAGNNGIVIEYDGSNWSVLRESPGEYLYGIWGTSETDLYVVGKSSVSDGQKMVIHHYDGTGWETEYNVSDNGEALRGIWGSSAASIFAVGFGGKVLNRDDSQNTWQEMSNIKNSYLQSVWGSGENDVFVVGSAATILHYTDRGDFDHNGSIDLSDAIQVLGANAGLNLGDLFLSADVNSDQYIGIADAIYILRKIAGN